MKQQQFRFTEDVYLDAASSGARVRVPLGTEFVATLDFAKRVVRGTAFDAVPTLVPTDRLEVVSSDLDAAPGCLTSCIRVGTCEPTGPAKDL